MTSARSRRSDARRTASFAAGTGPVSRLMISGIYPPDVRRVAESTATVNRGTNFAVSFTFLTLVCALTRSGAFCRYAGIGLLAISFTLARMPDRRGRNLQQIQRHLGVPLYRGERRASGCDAALNRRQCGPQDAGASSAWHAGRSGASPGPTLSSALREQR